MKEYNPSKVKSKHTEDPLNTIFVGRLSYDITERKLRREFEAYGPIKKCSVVNDLDGNPRGYAFIEYENEKDMRAAFDHADGKKLDGRRIVVDCERGRSVKDWLPMRLGGGKGGRKAKAKKGEVNIAPPMYGGGDRSSSRAGGNDRRF